MIARDFMQCWRVYTGYLADSFINDVIGFGVWVYFGGWFAVSLDGLLIYCRALKISFLPVGEGGIKLSMLDVKSGHL